jgi:hypothetical protein
MNTFHRTTMAVSAALLMSAPAWATTSVVVNAPGQGSVSSYTATPQPARQTVVIGIYTGGVVPAGSTVGTVTVHVNGKAPSKPVTLVLSSYEQTNWKIDGKTRSAIGTVILDGYHKSTVSGVPFFAKVVNRSGEATYWGDCAIVWPDSPEGCETPKMKAGVEAYTKTPISSFTGIYEASEFTVNLTK